jgi:hypothetical protein
LRITIFRALAELAVDVSIDPESDVQPSRIRRPSGCRRTSDLGRHE